MSASKIAKLEKARKDLLKLGLKDQAKAVAEEIRNLQEVAVMFKIADGRLYVCPPDPGFMRRKAMANQLREAGRDTSGPTHKWEGVNYEEKSPLRGMWSFKATESIIAKVRQVLGDFFSSKEKPAKLVDFDGKECGKLPLSTYQGKQS